MRKRCRFVSNRGCNNCDKRITNDVEEEEAAVMVSKLNNRMREDECVNCFICRQCERLLSVVYDSDVRFSEPADLCYNDNRDTATFCKDCTRWCYRCLPGSDGLYCDEWTDDHDDCVWLSEVH